MPVRLENGQPWRLTYGPCESPPLSIATLEDASVNVGERGVRSREIENKGMRSEDRAFGSTGDLLQQMNSLHRPKNVRARTGPRFDTRAPKSFDSEAVLDRMLKLLSGDETSFQGYANLINKDGLKKVKEIVGRCVREEVRQACIGAPWSQES